jgi:hypothetical protein
VISFTNAREHPLDRRAGTRSYGSTRIVPLIATPITTLAATKEPPHSPGLSVRAAPSAAAVIATHAQARPSSNSIFERHVVDLWLGPVPRADSRGNHGRSSQPPEPSRGIVSPRVRSGDSFSPLA